MWGEPELLLRSRAHFYEHMLCMCSLHVQEKHGKLLKACVLTAFQFVVYKAFTRIANFSFLDTCRLVWIPSSLARIAEYA